MAIVEQPVPSPDAFGDLSEAGVMSAAAVLLALGIRLRGDEDSVAARSAALRDDEGRPATEVLPEEDFGPLNIPWLPATGERVNPEEARNGLLQQGFSASDAPPWSPAEVARRLHEEHTHSRAAELFEACLDHPNPLIRVSAASSYLDLTTDPRRPLGVLRDGIGSDDELTRELAATVVAQFAPRDAGLDAFERGAAEAGGGEPATTCALIHGTWARKAAWWQPGGDFHNYFTTVRPDVYSATDRFSWTGRYSDEERALGALDLVRWVSDRGFGGLDLFTHSHGGSVAMLATRGGLDVGLLVLLSCPVHIPKYIPDFTRVGRVVSIRVRADVVLMGDRAGQRFRHPQIEEHRLPVYFDHAASHDPEVWKKYNAAAWF